jgi:hypothetical protein
MQTQVLRVFCLDSRSIPLKIRDEGRISLAPSRARLRLCSGAARMKTLAGSVRAVQK